MNTMLMTVGKLLDPAVNLRAATELISIAWRRRELVWELTRREVLDRYAGQVLGGAWAVISPLLLMGVYVFAFTILFRARMADGASSLAYAAYVLSAMAPWVAAADVLGRAPTAVTASANLVKQIVFPNQILPLKVALGALPTLFIGVAVTVMIAALSGHGSAAGLALLVIPIVLHIVMMTGLTYLLAAVGVFMRDVKDIVAILLSVGLFLHPIVYAPGVAPAPLRILFFLSPLSYVLWCFREALYDGGIVHPWIWIVAAALSAASFALGYRVYRMLQHSFGNVL